MDQLAKILDGYIEKKRQKLTALSEYIWLGEPDVVATLENDDCDITLITKNFATLSPIKVDMCAHASLDELGLWARGINE